MGERQSDGRAPGRRHAHPGGLVSGHGQWAHGVDLEVLLAGAIRSGALDAEAEQRAVAAFRAARQTGPHGAHRVHGARTRRRDDWRPRERGRARRSLKATVTLVLASLTVGGVAFAAIGTVGPSHDDHGTRHQDRPSAGPADRSATGPSGTSAAPGASTAPDRPATAQDTEAHCAAYEKVKGNGKALDSTVWQRLIAAAGGETNVAAYCAGQLEQATAAATPSATPSASNPGKSGKAGKPENPGSGKATDPGNGKGN